MTANPLLTRRRLLQATGGVAATGLAGCLGTQSNNANLDRTTDDHDDGEDGHDEGGDGHDGGDDSHGHDEAVGAPADNAHVTMVTGDHGDHFEPHVVRVNVGGSVTWENESGAHSATAYHPENGQPQLVPDGAAAWDSGILTVDDALFEHTFETPGVYHYYCTPHEMTGMIGSVIVGEPDAHEQPALVEPPAAKPDTVREKLVSLNDRINEALGHHHDE